ncbi:MAG: YihY/virulence factor BrkB family protein, partial [Betaproteobacteria bacterium]
MKLKSIFDLSKSAAMSWIDDFAPSMGAALAYYTVFSMAPLLIIVIAVAGLVFGQQAAQEAIIAQAQGLLGAEGTDAIKLMLENAQHPKEGLFAGTVSVVMLFIGATTVFAELESALNRIWKVEAPKESGLWSFIHTRLLSIGMVLALGFLLLVSLFVSAALAAWGSYWGGMFGGMESLLQAANFILSFVVITVLFAIIYKFLPQAKVQWRDVWVGAGVTSLLFGIGKLLIGLYIGKAAVSSAYGAAGALVVLLVWVYYSSQIFL